MPSAKPLCTSAALSLLLLSARFHEGVSPRHFDDCGHFIGVLCWQSQCKCQCQPVAVAGWRGCGGVGEGWPFGCGRAWRTGGSPLFSLLSLSLLSFWGRCSSPLGVLWHAGRPAVQCSPAKVRFRNTGGTGIEPVARCAGDLSCQSWASCPTKLLVKTDTISQKDKIQR